MRGFARRFMPRFGHGFSHHFLQERKQVTLTQMYNGQSGVVVEVLGGQSAVTRLSNLGVRPGQRLTKIGSMFMRGPVTVQVGNAQLAIGFGMANKIVVEPA